MCIPTLYLTACDSRPKLTEPVGTVAKVSVVRMSRVVGTLRDMKRESARPTVDVQQGQFQRSWAPTGPAGNGLEAMRWNGKDSQCSICLEDLDGSSKQMQTSCGHSFHEHVRDCSEAEP